MKKTPKQNQQADISSEINSIESSPATTPVHIVKNDLPSNIAHSFSNMDMSSPTNRNLSEKELRDCDVIGMYISFLLFLF